MLRSNGVEFMPECERLAIGAVRGRPLTITVDGVPLRAFHGETIGAALLAHGRRILRTTLRAHAPRGLFCGMGVCFDCAVTVNGVANVRSCVTLVEDGMAISTGTENHEYRTD
jgi:sarcosine oxidase subunit alpha